MFILQVFSKKERNNLTFFSLVMIEKSIICETKLQKTSKPFHINYTNNTYKGLIHFTYLFNSIRV